MNYSHAGTAFGREIYAPGPSANLAEPPRGFSIAAIVLKDGWKSAELGWLLNELYGSLNDWTEFDPNGGARSFVFFGERADEASDLCDTFAYAWTNGAERQYDDVIATSNDWPSLEAFIEGTLSGEISIGDAYADRIQNTIFSVAVSDPPTERDGELVRSVADSVVNAVRQHAFD